MDDVAAFMDDFVPQIADDGDWPSVLRDGGERRGVRVRWLTLAVAPVAAITVAAAILAWPSTSSGPTILERALAAVGTGSVAHIVVEQPKPHTLYDLATGERTVMATTVEYWYDPARGMHAIVRFGDTVQDDVAVEPGKGWIEEEILRGFATSYRKALASGKAKIVEHDELDGEPVTWIGFTAYADESYVLHVAVSDSTYEPVAMRLAQGNDFLVVPFVSAELLGDGEGDFDADTDPPATASGVGPGRVISLADAASLLKKRPVWPGPRIGSRELREVEAPQYTWQPSPDSEPREGRAVRLSYRSPTGEQPVDIELRAELDPAMSVDVLNYLPPEGSILIGHGPGGKATGLLRSNGVVVVIEADDEATTLAFARALRPYDG